MTRPAVVQVVSVLPATGGVAAMVVRTALAARRRGYEVTVVVHRPVTRGNPHAALLRQAGIRLLAPRVARFDIGRRVAAAVGAAFSLAAVLPYALLRGVPLRAARGKLAVEAAWALYGRSRQRRLDRGFLRALAASCSGRPCLVHLHSLGWPSCGLALRWAEREGVPLAFHFHNDLDRAQRASLERIFSGGERERLLRHPVFIALTPSIAGKLRAFLGEGCRIEVVPNWVDDPAVGEPAVGGDGAISLCFVGRVVGGKGVEDLIRAVARLAGEGEKVRCTIVGGGVGVPYMSDLVSRLGLEREVSLVGELGRRETLSRLAAADVLALLSETEGLPLVLLEAYALGKAVITTPVGGIPDVFKDGTNGLLVGAGDVEGLAAAIGRLARDRPLAARCGANNRTEYLARFTEAAVWPRLEGLYDGMTGDR